MPPSEGSARRRRGPRYPARALDESRPPERASVGFDQALAGPVTRPRAAGLFLATAAPPESSRRRHHQLRRSCHGCAAGAGLDQVVGEQTGPRVDARSRALLSDGDAEALLPRGDRTAGPVPAGAHLARAHLIYGEWLRRQHRRTDAREQLRRAHDMFVVMGADGFAGRHATSCWPRGNVCASAATTPATTDPQEEHIARLARDGRTNPEIGAELFLSPRTVEWHLERCSRSWNQLAQGPRRRPCRARAASVREAARHESVGRCASSPSLPGMPTGSIGRDPQHRCATLSPDTTEGAQNAS